MRHTGTNTASAYREWLTIATRRRDQRPDVHEHRSTKVCPVAWRRAMATAAAVCALASGCGGDGDVDPSTLDVGAYSTAVRTIPDDPSPANDIALEGLRMSDAVADT